MPVTTCQKQNEIPHNKREDQGNIPETTLQGDPTYNDMISCDGKRHAAEFLSHKRWRIHLLHSMGDHGSDELRLHKTLHNTIWCIHTSKS